MSSVVISNVVKEQLSAVTLGVYTPERCPEELLSVSRP